jgi:hypothetical protein
MNQMISDSAATTPNPEVDTEVPRQRLLPSGRSIVVKMTKEGEELQVRSPGGEVEVRITLGDNGPVVHLSGASLQLEALDTVAVKCRRLEVNTEESTHLHSGGDLQLTGEEMRVKTKGDIHLNGDVIRLNC